MDKWFRAFGLGMQVLAAIEMVKAHRPATLEVEWKGTFYKLVLTQVKQ